MKYRAKSVLRPKPSECRALPYFVVERSVLSADECEAILDSRSCRTRYYRSDSSRFARRVDISYVSRNAAPGLFATVAHLASRTNVWGVALAGVADDMRIQRYRRADYTDMHSDYDCHLRDFSKLTIVIPLVGPSEWEGGELQIGNSLRSPSLKRGDAVVFPSFIPHGVTRVAKGVRVVLSAWVLGPPLR